jgi:hypothetical protein
MANQSAWQSGWDQGSQGAAKQTPPPAQKPTDQTKQKPTKGLMGAISKGVGKLKGKLQKPKAKSAAANPGEDSANGSMPKETFQEASPKVASYKKGGRVKKTGLALVHRGEFVIPAKRSRHKKASGKRTIIKH